MVKKQKSFIIHPILFSIFPIIFIFSENIHLLPITEIFFPIIFMVSLTIVTLLLVSKKIQNKNKLALIISLLIIIFFSYGHFYNILNDSEFESSEISRHRYLLIPFFGAGVLGTIYFLKSKRKFNNLTTITNGISVTIIVLISINITTDVSNGNFFGSAQLGDDERWFGVGAPKQSEVKEIFGDINEKEIEEELENIKYKPDVYYIISDEYPGNYGLKEFFDYDNTNFIKFLEKNEFSVINNSSTNYPSTIQSLSSSLNMEYLDILTEGTDIKSKNYHTLNKLLSDNLVMEKFVSHGYRVFNVGALWGPNGEFRETYSNLCEFKEVNRDSLLQEVLEKTMISYFYEKYFEQLRRDQIICTFNEIQILSDNNVKPKFVFVHILSPHAPYIFGPNGENVSPISSSDNVNNRNAHVSQVKFMNKNFSELIPKLLDSDKKPIIILQGDTGSGFGINSENPTNSMMKERMSNLNAIYFPNNNYDEIYDDLTPVNTFRIIFNEFFNENYTLLQDKNFWSESDKPYKYTDITKIIVEENLMSFLHLDDGDTFGSDIGLLGDLDGDGINDILVGASEDDDGGKDRGAVYILFLNEDGTVKKHQKISDTEGNFEGKIESLDYFGRDIDDIGDLDGDGINELAVGAFRDDNGGKDRGAVYILFLNEDGTVKKHQKIPNIIN